MTVATAGREAALASEVLAALDPYFSFKLEHPGTHFNGSRYRIDAIAVPRDRHNWSRPDIALGIEFKAPTDRHELRRERKDNARIISQCIDYSFTAWDGFGQIPIFFCPGFAETKSLRDRREDWLFSKEDYHLGFQHGIGYLMEAMLGQNNIGELIYTSHTGWNFLMNGDCRIWSERLGKHPGGVGVGKRHKMQRRSGSR
jgi:hypothetical protein